MLERLSKSPFSLPVLAIIAVVFVFNYAFAADQNLIDDQSLNYSIFLNGYAINTWLKAFIAAVFTFISYFIIREVCREYRFIEGTSFTFGLFYFVTLLVYPEILMQTSIVLSSILCLWALHILLKIYNQTQIKGLIFGSSFLIGIAFLLFYPAIIFFILGFITMAMFRPIEVKNYFIAIIGLSLPLLYFTSYCYLFDADFDLYDLELLQFNMGSIDHVSWIIGLKLFFILTGILLCFYALTSKKKLVVRQRNQLIVLFLFLLISVILSVLISTTLSLLFAGILSLFFHLYYSQFKRKWILDLIVFLFIGLVFLDKYIIN